MATRNKADHFWYARNPSKFRRKTAHLSLMEVGAYDRLLDWYYENRKPLSDNWVHLHRICGAVAPEEQDAVQSVVKEFFVLKESGWHNKHADEELAKAAEISEKRAAAQAEKERQRLAKQGANAPAKAPTDTDTTTIDSNKLESISPRVRAPNKIEGEDFSEFFKAYPKPTAMGAARSSFTNAILMRGADPKQIINAAKNFATKEARRPDDERRYIPNPAKWLDSECYADPDLQEERKAAPSLNDFTGWHKKAAEVFGLHIAKAWFLQCTLDGETLHAPSRFVRDHIKQQYAKELKDALNVTNIICEGVK